MNDFHTAFGPLQLRTHAPQDGAPADRISVRDYICEAEIGAFASERGVTQRLRFNVVLEVARSAAAQDDDVDQVVSYDTIVNAIDRLLSGDRIDLLETLAERIARACLEDRRVIRAVVRVEKLDRIPGALGVEIVRSQIAPDLPRLGGDAAPGASPPVAVDILYLGPDAFGADGGRAWLDAIARSGRHIVTCVGPANPVPPPRSVHARRIGYLEIEMAALRLADLDGRFEIVSSQTELEWSLGAGLRPIWAPARMADAARSADMPDASQPLALAGWLAARLGGRLLAASADAALLPGAIRLAPDAPEALAAP